MSRALLHMLLSVMKRIAIFGNAGGGKSTLARELAAITRLPLTVIDKLEYPSGGVLNPHEQYLRAHAALLASDEWIIDGYGCSRSVWERLDAADTLIHVDLPLSVHALGVTKRLLGGFFAAPEGWPANTPLVSTSIESYKVLWPCHAHLTPKYRSYVAKAALHKRVFHLRSRRDMKQFLKAIKVEYSQADVEHAD